MKVLTRSRILMTALLFPMACGGGSQGGGSGGSSATGGSGSGTGGSSSSTGGSSATGGSSSTGGSSPATGGKGGSSATGGVMGTGGSATGGTGAGGKGGSGSGTGGSGTGGSATGGTGGTVSSGDDSVLERNKHPSRDGLFVEPSITKAAAMTMAPDTKFNTNATWTSTVSNGTAVQASLTFLDGASGTGTYFIPTAGGDVVALKEDGTSLWTTNVGAPATGGIGCSNPTTPPLGILSTPVIDAQSKTIYVAGIVGTSSGVTNQIASAIDITTGKVKSGWPVKVDMAASFDPTIHNQRSALSLVNGILYVPYAGYVGDCGKGSTYYHGRVVSISTSNPATVGQWATADTGGGIWASGGLASDGTSVFAATGNYVPFGMAAPSHMDSEEVVRITGMGTKADFFYSSDWSSFDMNDADLGSTNPMLITVDGATPSKLVVAIAKGGSGYLLDASQLRGTTTGSTPGGQLATFTLATGTGMNIYGAPASYKTSMGTYIVGTSNSATGCPGTGGTGRQVMAFRVTPSPLGAKVAWCSAMSGGPTNAIATSSDGTNDSIVWFTSSGKLIGVDGDTGATIYSSTTACGGTVQHWTSPIAVKGRILVAGNGHVCAWGIPSALTAQASPAEKTRRHKRTIASATPTRL
jgi:hypothetical protein